jgi:hypothetical protein
MILLTEQKGQPLACGEPIELKNLMRKLGVDGDDAQ